MTRSVAAAAIALGAWSVIAAWAGPGVEKPMPLSIIVVSSEAEAKRVLAMLSNGADFAKVAREASSDPTATDGGYLGEMNPADLRPEFQAALRQMRPGQTSPVIRFQSSFAILKIGSAERRDTERNRDRTQLISSSSSVRWTADFSGYSTNLVVLNRYPKPDKWNASESDVCRVLNEAPPAAIGLLGRTLAGDDTGHRADLLTARASVLAAGGELDGAIRDLEAAYKLEAHDSPAKIPYLEEWQGTVRIQRAGTALYDSFVLGAPRPAAAISPAHLADLESAIGHFNGVLREQPSNYEVRWLLNLAYMLEGRYPAAVPPSLLIAPEQYRPPASVSLGIPHFRDVAAATGVVSHQMAGGVIADDFDGDGRMDVLISSLDDCEPMKLYHNNGDGTFTNRAVEAGLASQTGALNLIQTDFDNNGCIDILALRGGWEFPRRKSLLRNNCDGTFTDVTEKAGLLNPLTASQTAVWVDIDNDGNLDLFVGNENGPSQLFLNKGNGTFVDIAEQAGITRRGFTKGVVAADYDNDGFVDLYVSNFKGQNFLYHNNGNRTFTEVGEEAGVENPWSSFGAFFFDYDNDGWPDLLVTGYCMSVEESVRGYLGLPRNCESSKLYHNLRNGKFEDVSKEAGLDRAIMPMGLNIGDIDNDGFLDFYFGSGNPSFATAIPNLMFHNEGGKRFTDVTAPSGTGILPKGHGVAFADLGNNGQEDLLVVMGGAVRSDAHNFRVFENPGNGNDWISIHLTGVKSNRVAIGARITVTVSNGGHGSRTINRTVGSGGSFGANPFTQHVGIGKDAKIESVEVWWPASGTKQKFTGVGKNQFIEIKEFAESVQKRDLRPFRLGGRAKETAAEKR